jgi:hypothetical protein
LSILKCQTNISLALGKYYEALHSTKRFWRFKNIYAGFIWIYLVSFLVCTFVFYYFLGASFVLQRLGIAEQSDTNHHSNGIFAVTWGIIGGDLRGFWFLKENVDKRLYRNAWTVWFISSPFIGGILRILAYSILVGGLFTLAKINLDITNDAAIIAISTVAGFAWPSSMELTMKI